MSKYTTNIRFIVDSLSQPTEGKTIIEKIDEASPKIFNFPYPIWDESYKTVLQRKILMRYYMREICAETVGLWKLFLNEKLNDIMPYYVELYNTTQKDIDFLSDYIMATSEEKGETGKDNFNSNSNTSTENSGNITVNSSDTNTDESNGLVSDTPGVNLVANKDYATQKTEDSTTQNREHEETTNNSNNTTTKNNAENIRNTEKSIIITRTVKGYGKKSPAELLQEWRKTLLNIDSLIVGDLQDLFMQIY